MINLSLEDYVNNTKNFLDEFWDKSKAIDKESLKDQLLEHIKENLLKIAVSDLGGKKRGDLRCSPRNQRVRLEAFFKFTGS